MDDFVGFIAERIAQQIKAARDAEAEQRRLAEAIAAKNAGSVVARPAAPGGRPAPTASGARDSRAIGSPAALPTPPVPAAPASGMDPKRVPKARNARVNLDDAFPSSLDTPSGGAPRPMPANALLAAFVGGSSLLGALVLSEALAPPVALRNEPPHRR